MDHVSNLIIIHGYVLIFAVVFLDQAAISMPSPPFVTAMGALASTGRFNIWSAFIIVFVAALLSDYMWFRIGLSIASRPHKVACSKQWTEQQFPKIRNLLRRGVLAAIVTVKFSLVPSALVPLAIGSAGVTTRRFIYSAAVSNLTWTAAYLIAGFAGGYAIVNLLCARTVLVTCTLVFALLLTIYGFRKFRTR
jgi:membrane protein DedA with SNARE-associated domain